MHPPKENKDENKKINWQTALTNLSARLTCRYLLHLPGQGYSSRLKNLLLCKSPVIFPRDGNDEFWYHLLQVELANTVSAFFRWELQSPGNSHASLRYIWLATREILMEDYNAGGILAARRCELVKYLTEVVRSEIGPLQGKDTTRHCFAS